jgi:hypothetical protein
VLPGEPTRVWRYSGQLLKGPADTLEILSGSYLGPVIRLRRGRKVRVRFVNQLEEDSEVTNRAGTYWYHPHPHMRTARRSIRVSRVCSWYGTTRRMRWRCRRAAPNSSACCRTVSLILATSWSTTAAA